MKKRKLTQGERNERNRIVRYIRREAKRLTVLMPVPDQIIRDTMLAVAGEIARGLHETRAQRQSHTERKP